MVKVSLHDSNMPSCPERQGTRLTRGCGAAVRGCVGNIMSWAAGAAWRFLHLHHIRSQLQPIAL